MKIDAGVCAQLVNTIYRSCPTEQAKAAPPEPQHFDALANSFASLSAAFTWGTIVLALVTIALAFGWGYLVRGWAEKEAKREAAECVKAHMDKWRAEEAPQLVRRHIDNIQGASLNKDDEDRAADEIGKEAG